MVAEPGRAAIGGIALLAFFAWTATSWARWANFSYRSFDLAYYVQALWQLIHGRLEVSVQYVPLLGNHVEPILFLFAPIFFVFRHPMLFVVLQNAALAAMGPVAYSIARRVGFSSKSALFLSAALLATPATGYVALHEFHPEALTALFLLLMWRARLMDSRGGHWLWFIAALACKENMAVLLAAYCVVHLFTERKRELSELARWYLWPLAAALVWFVLCTTVITPAFNAGNIDYAALYERIGGSASEILRNAFSKPQLILGALRRSLTQGNLLPALLLPFLGLPLLRPKWLLVASPIIFQHLLSWRSSEWTIYFHYAAPLLPLFWIAAIEAISTLKKLMPSASEGAMPTLVLLASLGGQLVLGPVAGIEATARDWFAGRETRERKQSFIASIPSEASVVAPLPYLAHLAMRQELHSLHYLLKGLKTLSRTPFDPPSPTDYVLLDYGDFATFDPSAGYYHPTMRALGGRVFPSSDRLLHEFLRPAQWNSQSTDELTLLQRVASRQPAGVAAGAPLWEIAPHTRLFAFQKSGESLARTSSIEIKLLWQFEGERTVFPWLALRLSGPKQNSPILLHRGLCAPEADQGSYEERWQITSAGAPLPPGDYQVEALFIDNSRGAWARTHDSAQPDPPLLAAPIALGALRVE